MFVIITVPGFAQTTHYHCTFVLAFHLSAPVVGSMDVMPPNYHKLEVVLWLSRTAHYSSRNAIASHKSAQRRHAHAHARPIGRSRFRRTEHTNTRISSGFGGRIKCNKDMAIVQAKRACACVRVRFQTPTMWTTWTTTATSTRSGTREPAAAAAAEHRRLLHPKPSGDGQPHHMGHSIYCRVPSSFARQFPLRMTDIFHCAMKSFVGKFIHPAWATCDGTRRTVRTRCAPPLRSYNFAANKLHSACMCMCTRANQYASRRPHTLSLYAGRAI